MIRFFQPKFGPIGVDIGSRSIKLVQLTADRQQVVDTARWEWIAPNFDDEAAWNQSVVQALRGALSGRAFRGRQAVLGLSHRHCFVQSIRVPKSQDEQDLTAAVEQETAARLPFPIEETLLDYWESGDIRQGESLLRELIVFACHQAVAKRLALVAQAAGLHPIAIDVEPAAIVRSYCAQFRRDEERLQRALLLHIGYQRTAIVICQYDTVLFVKYLDVGGAHLDQCAAQALNLSEQDAHGLRRRLDSAEPDVARSFLEAVRPVLEQLIREISLCVRYYSVTFRGRTLERMVVGGGEADERLTELLGGRLGIPAVVSDPFRRLHLEHNSSHPGLWDVAAGLALRQETAEVPA
jgi:type IV pilus assembly protein PilM